MNETERIAEELRLLFEGTSWLGPSIEHLLSDVSAEAASSRPLPNAHSIWELVLHMKAWLAIARLRLTASSPLDPSDDENWPAPSGSWHDAKLALETEMETLRQAILRFPSDRLEECAPAAEPQTFYILLHGVVQHCAYHAGQIALLKKVAVQIPERGAR